MEQTLAKLLLGLFVVVLALHLFTKQGSKIKAYKKILLALFCFIIILTIFLPETVTFVAQLIGITRGADLLLYMTTILVIFKIIDDSFRRQSDHKKDSKVIRKIALLEKKIDDLSEK